MYYKQIDGIRAFAVAGPIMVHLWPKNVPDTQYTAALMHLGSLGVDLFFVISGFLITGILLRSRSLVVQERSTVRNVLGTFYIRRAIRIFPIYYLLLIVLFLLGLQEMRDHGVWYFTYLANFRIIDLGSWPGCLSHVWSLSVEEQFYFIWPLLVLMVPTHLLRPLFIALFCISPIIRSVLVHFDANSMTVSTLPFTCLDPLAGGALLALIMSNEKHAMDHRILKWVGLFGGVCSVVSLSYYVVHLQGGSMNGQLPFQRTFISLFFIWLVGSVAMERTGPFKSVLLAKPIKFIGSISYGIYLYHLVIGWLLTRLFGLEVTNSMFWFLTIVVLTIVVSSLSWFLIEQPLNRLKQYFPTDQ